MSLSGKMNESVSEVNKKVKKRGEKQNMKHGVSIVCVCVCVCVADSAGGQVRVHLRHIAVHAHRLHKRPVGRIRPTRLNKHCTVSRGLMACGLL